MPASKGKGKNAGSSNKEDSTKLKGCQKITVRHILCEKQSKMLQAQEKLNEGGKFDVVAREFSEDKARDGGLIGTKLRGDLDPAFAAEAFELAESTVTKPITASFHTQHGWHIVMVEKRL